MFQTQMNISAKIKIIQNEIGLFYIHQTSELQFKVKGHLLTSTQTRELKINLPFYCVFFFSFTSLSRLFQLI